MMFEQLEDQEETIKALIYGKEGSGKTTCALQASKEGKVLVLNVEGGLKASALRKHGVNTKNVTVWSGGENGKITYEAIVNLHEKLLTDLTKNRNTWYCVIIDSVTELVNVLREKATNDRYAKIAKNRPNFEIDTNFVDRDDYGIMTNQMRKIIRMFRDLPCHVVMTALEKDNDEGLTVPAVTPALVTDLLGYVDLVLYTKLSVSAGNKTTGEDIRAKTRSTSGIRAKDRFDALPDPLVLPTFERIAGYVKGELDENKDPLQIKYRKETDLVDVEENDTKNKATTTKGLKNA